MIKHILTRYPNYQIKSYKEYYNNILIWQENYDEHGNKHGTNNSSDNDVNYGPIKMQNDYKHGVEHGKHISWYPNGNKAIEAISVNGKHHGTLKLYSLTQLYQTIEFVQGLRHGKLITYNTDGKIFKEEIYEYDIKIKTIKHNKNIN